MTEGRDRLEELKELHSRAAKVKRALAAWEKERADFNYANEAANKGVAEREMVQSELAALRAAVERIEGEMRKQCDQRYEDARFEDAASTTDLVCWADDLRSAREGGKP